MIDFDFPCLVYKRIAEDYVDTPVCIFTARDEDTPNCNKVVIEKS